MQTPSIPITAYTITLSLMTYLIDQADRGEVDGPLSTLAPEELDTLRNLPLRDLFRLTEQRQPILRLSIDPGQLRICLARLRQRDNGDADKLWFVRRGAPHVLMAELFGMPVRDFRYLRRSAGLPDKPGRPRQLEPEIAARVLRHWRQLNSRLPLAERYMQLGDAFEDVSLAALYAALHDDQASTPAGATGVRQAERRS